LNPICPVCKERRNAGQNAMMPITGYPDYFVDECGTIFSFRRKMPVAMRPYLTKHGYLRTKIANESGIKWFMAHRLIAMAWIPQPADTVEINHIDGIKNNNHPSNLEWVSKARNVQHAFELGLNKPLRGSTNGNAKLNERQVVEIKQELKNYRQGILTELGDKYGVSKQAIDLIHRGKNWAHISA